ncbi:MAG: NAD-binding protein [Candidatus Lokiarchaeota archaeon]|nr:NAD-binding protein [Candidatus Lokiarchaeota archaeon]
MLKKTIIKFQIALAQNRHMLVLIALWFALNYLLLLAMCGDIVQAAKYLFYLEDLDTDYGHFYAKYSEFVVFGLLIGLVTVDVFRNYDPSKTCEILASKEANHAIVFGHDHLGIRLHEYLKKHRIPSIVVSRDKGSLSELYEDEDPAVLYDTLDDEFPKKVQFKKAKYLFLLEEDIVLNLRMILLAKDLGSRARIAVRCFQDNFAPVFEKYGATVLSASSTTAKSVFAEYLSDPKIREITIIGHSHFAERVSINAVLKGIHNSIIADSDEIVQFHNKLGATERQLVKIFRGNPMDYKILQEAGVFDGGEGKAIVIAIESNDVILLAKALKEKNPSALVIARTFSDEIERVLESLGVIPISTSKHALRSQIVPFLEGK